MRVMCDAAQYFLPQKIHDFNHRSRVIREFVADPYHDAPPAIRPAKKQPITIDVYSTIASFFSSLIICYPCGNDWSCRRATSYFYPQALLTPPFSIYERSASRSRVLTQDRLLAAPDFWQVMPVSVPVFRPRI